MNEVHFSSKSNEWHTPDWLYKQLDDEFHFDLDAASTDENAKCPKHFTEKDDALGQDWAAAGKTVWLNPPYGRLIGKFVKKAYEESLKGLIVVLLIPARPDTKWWHAYCAKGEVRFVKGRLKFVNPTFPTYREDGNFKLSPAPFPSAIVVFGRGCGTSYVEYKENL